ncbi:MAG TPA: TRAP transporter small permease subunit, partial [bacterium]|nr:TRAP transporter small permease subunit [bacterium]
MQPLLAFARAVDRWNRRIAGLMAWLVLLMVLVGAWNAVGRDLGKRLDVRLTSNALLELQWYLFGLAFLFGAPYALRRAAHVRVDVLYGSLTERARLWIDLCCTLLLLLPATTAAIALSFEFVGDSWRDDEWSSDPGGLPRWP